MTLRTGAPEQNMTFATADLFDHHADQLQVCSPVFRDFGKETRFCGPIRTLKVFWMRDRKTMIYLQVNSEPTFELDKV